MMRAVQVWMFGGGHVGHDSYDHPVVADQFLWVSLTQYLIDVAAREEKAIQALNPPKQIALFCGPQLYQPDTEKAHCAEVVQTDY